MIFQVICRIKNYAILQFLFIHCLFGLKYMQQKNAIMHQTNLEKSAEHTD